MLKEFFIQKGKDKLLDECQTVAKNKMDITDSQKNQCVNLVADFGIELFGLNPDAHQYKLLALAAIDLIDGLKSKSGEPTV